MIYLFAIMWLLGLGVFLSFDIYSNGDKSLIREARPAIREAMADGSAFLKTLVQGAVVLLIAGAALYLLILIFWYF